VTSKLQQFIDQNKLYQNEGERGVSNLCKIVAGLGYNDPMYFGQLSQGGKVGDLLEFLQDNPGAITAILEWIEETNVPEWDEALSEQIIEEDDEDEEGDE
jgi:hypothetical protein